MYTYNWSLVYISGRVNLHQKIKTARVYTACSGSWDFTSWCSMLIAQKAEAIIHISARIIHEKWVSIQVHNSFLFLLAHQWLLTTNWAHPLFRICSFLCQAISKIVCLSVNNMHKENMSQHHLDISKFIVLEDRFHR